MACASSKDSDQPGHPPSLITSLGEEGSGLCASHAFVCLFFLCFFVLVSFCHFLFLLGVWGWLWFVTVALPGLFY